MAMNVRCPHCERKLEVRDEWAGRSVRCPACKKGFKLPAKTKQQADRSPSTGIDLDALSRIETAGHGLVDERGRPVRVAPTQAAEETPGQQRPAASGSETTRICPYCRTKVKTEDNYSEVLCPHCWRVIPAADRPADKQGKDAKFSGSLIGRIQPAVGFYAGFGSAALYPIPGTVWILMGMGLAALAICLPVGVLVAFATATGLNPIAGETDTTWVGPVLALMFLIEGIYFGAVNYHILIDSIRSTVVGGETPSPLPWNPIALGTALLGYLGIAVYYLIILAILIVVAYGRLYIPNSLSELSALTKPGYLVAIAVITFTVPMNVIGLASSNTWDGFNPYKIGKSVAQTVGHYMFLFLIVCLFLMLYTGLMTLVMSWAGKAIFNAMEHGIEQGLVPVLIGLGAWSVLIGAGFYFAYVLGRILGLFARSYREKLAFDL